MSTPTIFSIGHSSYKPAFFTMSKTIHSAEYPLASSDWTNARFFGSVRSFSSTSTRKFSLRHISRLPDIRQFCRPPQRLSCPTAGSPLPFPLPGISGSTVSSPDNRTLPVQGRKISLPLWAFIVPAIGSYNFKISMHRLPWRILSTTFASLFPVLRNLSAVSFIFNIGAQELSGRQPQEMYYAGNYSDYLYEPVTDTDYSLNYYHPL